ncbi:Ig-like domain-containing protein [Longimicrobium sp.]|uniref:Ig-like domain-containing protein n=1 Tax=Longimicrobium sp. TaxID=2029185 RepID=UPI003B3BC9CF
MRRHFLASILAGALLLLAGCMDSPVDTEGVPEGHARLVLNATASLSAATLVVEVTGPGIGEPLVFNLPVVDGIASGSVDVPVGSSRVFAGRLYDAGGTETHRGQVTTAVRPGANDAVSLRLEPLNGEQPVDVVISSYTVEIVPLAAPIMVGRNAQIQAIVRDADNNVVPDAKVVWGVTTPGIARIGPSGLLEVTGVGPITVVGIYGGAAATLATEGLSVAAFQENRLRESYRRWWNTETQVGSAGMMLSVQSFQHSAWASNWGMYLYSEYPRTAIQNDPAQQYYPFWSSAWTGSYDGIAALREGFEAGGAWPNARAEAFASFMLGLHLGNIALLFDQGLIVNESQDPATAQLRPYNEVMATAIAHLNEARALSLQGGFTIPAEWTSTAMTSDQLARLASSFKARFRANVARTPAERAAVNWAQVITEANNGIFSDFAMEIDWADWEHYAGYYMTLEASGWSQLHYQYLGMADQSGNYQTWINLPVADRHPVLPGGAPFLIVTPDNRFAQGATLGQQRVSPGRYYYAPNNNPVWGQPTRGSHRWSFYADQRFRSWRTTSGSFTWFPRRELDLLMAEGYFRLGDLGQTAMRVNSSRTLAGLNATNPGGSNTSCVPKLPSGECGGLFEMLKWEYRLETQFQGMFGAPWYFLARGWGDDYRGTQRQLPVPCGVLQTRGLACYTLGGVGGNSASPGSFYAWPFE